MGICDDLCQNVKGCNYTDKNNPGLANCNDFIPIKPVEKVKTTTKVHVEIEVYADNKEQAECCVRDFLDQPVISRMLPGACLGYKIIENNEVVRCFRDATVVMDRNSKLYKALNWFETSLKVRLVMIVIMLGLLGYVVYLWNDIRTDISKSKATMEELRVNTNH
jgi:hypothetical protein